jgi:putative SOS response-associated peptidase YedK
VCGRYTLYHDEEDLTSLFGLAEFPLEARYNIAPTQHAPIVREAGGARERLDARWGLLPHWVKDPTSFKTLLFNGRCETAAEKPSFRDALARSRCVVPASGFYEWAKRDGSKQPHHIVRRDGAPLLFAGLYSLHPQAGPTFTILTTSPNRAVEELHDRMPVILEGGDLPRWLDPSLRADAVSDLLGPAPDDVLDLYPVGKAVGNSRLEGPELVQRLAG